MKRSPVTRLRQLTPEQEQRFGLFRRVSHLLDSALKVPGTSIRFGLDPILGLIPGIGDLTSPLFTLGIIWLARDLGIPRVVQLRMIVNVAIDTLLGIVPVAGDLFDFAWKANDRNLALLDRHALEEHRPSAGDWAFVAVATVALGVIAVAPFLLLGWLLTVIGNMFSTAS
jgi:hypothetical protein